MISFLPPHRAFGMLISGFLALGLLDSCTGDTLYSSFAEIPRDGWKEGQYCRFHTCGFDSVFVNIHPNCDIILTVRHTGDVQYQELWLEVLQSPQDLRAIPDTLRIPLKGKDGRWRGHSSKGLYELSDTLAKDVSIPGCYSMLIGPAMGNEPVEGILDMGLTITSSEN